jgi:hypothetical protein
VAGFNRQKESLDLSFGAQEAQGFKEFGPGAFWEYNIKSTFVSALAENTVADLTAQVFTIYLLNRNRRGQHDDALC